MVDLCAHVVSHFLWAAGEFLNSFPEDIDNRDFSRDLRAWAEKVESGQYDEIILNLQMEYREQLELCADHKFIFLEYHRRHRNSLKCEREVL